MQTLHSMNCDETEVIANIHPYSPFIFREAIEIKNALVTSTVKMDADKVYLAFTISTL
jgi:hypothetical protein